MWIINLLSKRPAPAVTVQAHVELTHWHVIEFHGSRRVLLGVLPGQTTLRITTPVRSVDPATRTWVTQSGRAYLTSGAPTDDLQLIAQMRILARLGRIDDEVKDATNEIWAAMQRAVQ